MEFTPSETSSHESSDDSSSKKEKSSPKKTLRHVPVPVQIETAQVAEREDRARREEAETLVDKKKKSKKKSTTADTPTTPVLTEEKVDTETTLTTEKKEAHKDKAREVIEDVQETPEEIEASELAPVSAEQEKQPETEYLGELLISERSRKQREQQQKHQVNPVQAKKNANESIDDELLEEALLEEIDIEELEHYAEQIDDTADLPELSDAESGDEPDDSVVTVYSSAQASTTGSGRTRTTSSPPPTPPIPTPPAPPVPPTSPVSPISAGGGYYPPAPVMAAGNTYNAMPAPQVEVVSDRRAERRNLLTGLLVGGLIEHVRHKRRERRTEKEHAATIKKLSGEQQAEAVRAAEKERASSLKQTTLEKQLDRLKEQVTKPFAALANERQQPTLERVDPVQLERVHNGIPGKEAELRAKKTVEDLKAERNAAKKAEELAKDRAKQEQVRLTSEEAEATEQREIPQDRRVETSAWHSIEVDKKTGKAVEDPAVEYGEEFKHEQHQELLRRQIDEASLASENMRERYVQPHMELPAQSMYNQQQTPEQNQAQAAANDKSKTYKTDDGEQNKGVQAADVVLWGVFAVIVIVIVLLLAG